MADINNIKGNQPLNPATTQKNAPQTGKTADSSTAAPNQKSSSEDKVSLTGTATMLQSLQQQVREAPAVDSEKVEAIRAAIAEGNYPVDSEKLAQKMIDLEGQL